MHYDHVCDSLMDCSDGDDETFCHYKNKFPHFDDVIIHASFTIDLCDPPLGDMLMCRTKLQCYNSSTICHYDHSGGVMAHCEDGSHMGWGTHCQFVECRQYKCLSSYCIPTRKVCDGIVDCPVGDDEAMCSKYSCPGHMRCFSVSFCVPPHEICDDIGHCPHQEDEKYCQVCPQDCHCKGTAVYCHNVGSPLSIHNMYSPSALFLHNSFPMFMELYNQSEYKMNYVWLLNLKYGSFVSLLEGQVNIFEHYLSVKFLYLNHQGLGTLFSKFINGPNIIYLNLSHNIIQSVQENAFYFLKNARTLSLVSNKLNSLESHFCKYLNFLSSLYLADNPLKSIAADVFLENASLLIIRSD